MSLTLAPIARATRSAFGSRKGVDPRPEVKTVSPRMDWVDYAKGWCIVLVVTMHTVGGLNEALGRSGWINEAVAFAKPFRMPDFFLIAGLFLARSIDLPWRRFLDRKVLHFVYFYALWVTIQLGMKQGGLLISDPLAFLGLYLTSFVNPLGTLWFIFILPVFFAATKLARELHVPGWALLGAAAALEIGYHAACLSLGIGNPAMHIGPHELTGLIVFDEFALRYVYFVAGYLLAPYVFKLAEWAIGHVRATLAFLVVWAVINGAIVFTSAASLGLTETDTSLASLPVISLLLGAAGAMAVVAVSALLSSIKGLTALRYVGSRSIVIYLAFFLPMVALRELVERFAPGMDVSLAALIITAASVAAPLLLHQLVRKTGLAFLFERPAAVSIDAENSKRRVVA
jgi:uncharacterized membrane protein YcfT